MALQKVKDSMRTTTALDATKLSGNIDATQLTGAVPTGSLGNAPATDLTPLRQDIAMLALYNAVSDNRAAYNLPSSFIDQFENDTGVTTQTDVDNVSEYFASIYSVSASATTVYRGFHQFSSGAAIQTFSSVALGTAASDRRVVVVVGIGHVSATLASVTVGGVSGSLIRRQDGSDSMDTEIWLATVPTGTTGDVVVTQGAASNAGGMAVYTMHGASATENDYISVNNGNPFSGTIDVSAGGAIIGVSHANHGSGPNSTWAGITEDVDTQTVSIYRMSAAHDDFASAESGRTISCSYSTHSNSSAIAVSFDGGSSTATSATGTLISDQQTVPSAITKMSGVVLVKDGGSSTTAMGNHLKIYFCATGAAASFPSAWVEADSYTAVTAPFSTGVTMYKLGETTVPSGTLPTIRAVWASQTSGGFESQLHGWAMNY